MANEATAVVRGRPVVAGFLNSLYRRTVAVACHGQKHSVAFSIAVHCSAFITFEAKVAHTVLVLSSV